MSKEAEKSPANAAALLGDLAPRLVDIADGLLYGELWNDPALSPRDRSLVTVASLVSLYRIDQIDHHLNRALGNGVTKDELVHTITHLAFYAGFPAAMTAMTHLKNLD